MADAQVLLHNNVEMLAADPEKVLSYVKLDQKVWTVNKNICDDIFIFEYFLPCRRTKRFRGEMKGNCAFHLNRFQMQIYSIGHCAKNLKQKLYPIQKLRRFKY